MNIEGISLSPLVKELDKKLRGGRIDKIYQPDKYTIILHVRQYGQTLQLLLSAHPEKARMHLASLIPDNPKTAPSFCMLLRKHLEDGRIAEIKQLELDRVIIIEVDFREETGQIASKQLIAELMGKNSNIILVKDNIILDAVRHVGAQQNRYRHILPGRQYISPPPQTGVSLLQIDKSLIIKMINQFSSMSLAKAIIAACSGVGPLTAREICWRAGLPHDIKVSSLDDKDYASLYDAINSMCNSLSENQILPTAVLVNNKCKSITAFKAEHLFNSSELKTFATMSEALEFGANLQGLEIPNADIYQKTIANEIIKTKKKISNLEQDLANAKCADEVKKTADILMASIYKFKKGLSEIILPDIYSNEMPQPTITIKLNPELSPVDNAQQYYLKYNKLKRGFDQLNKQLRESYAWLNYLETIELSLSQISTLQELEEIRLELEANNIIKPQHKKSPSKQQLPTPLKIIFDDETTILIGKNNRQNDYLTFKIAHSNDIWMHAKDIPGSHVILKTIGNEPSDIALNRAASLAAYYSKARESTKVPVDYTKRKYVKKPSGAKPGFVIYENHKTILATPEK